MSLVKHLVDTAEIERYEEGVNAFLSGAMDPDRFMAFRLQHGIYGQRQDGVHMVRIKLPGGIIEGPQLNAIAAALENHSQHHVAHVTTRQDIQLHYVPVAETAKVMRLLGNAGLTTREACGNTVRNVTACPLMGMCPREHADMRPFVQAAAEHFLRHPLTQAMPRKFKISMSACETDCAQSILHDLGVVAIEKNGRYGFRIAAAGGLGHKPHEAIVVEEFVTEAEVLPCMEALIALHNRYSDRKRRAKARIKFLVDKFGREGFIEKYQQELARTKAAFADHDYPVLEWTGGRMTDEAPTTGAPRHVFPQKQPGKVVFPISLPIGDISGPQLRGLAKLMEQEGLSEIRATQDQNLMLVDVPEDAVPRIRTGITLLGLSEPQAGDNVVACPGTSTCRLGITSSKTVGAKLWGGEHDLRIRVSGCQNSCAQPEMGDIGIYGEGKRLHGKLVPHYQMFFGGEGRMNGTLALHGPSIPAARIEQAIERVRDAYAASRAPGQSFYAWSRAQGENYFTELLADLKQVSLEEVLAVARDHGDTEQFKVLQLGGGECAGAAQGLVAANFSEAAHERNYRDAFISQRKGPEACDCATQMLRLVGQSLLFLTGREPQQEVADIVRTLAEALPARPEIGAQLAHFDAAIAVPRSEFDEPVFRELAKEMDHWFLAAADVCQSVDKQLDLTASLPRALEDQPESEETQAIDLSGYGCPLHYIKARNELRRFGAGEVVNFVFASGEPSEQVSSSLRSDGHEILAVEEQGTTTRIKVRKAAH